MHLVLKRFALTVCLHTLLITVLSAQAKIHFSINEPCNVRIWDTAGKYFRPDSTYFWKNFMGTAFPDFPTGGDFVLTVPPGLYKYEMDRGPEYLLSRGTVTVGSKDLEIKIALHRLTDLKKQNWWSGELHVHRKVKDIEMLMKASDIHIAPVITSWNENYPYTRKDTTYVFPKVRFDGDRYYTITGSEDERDGGAILVLNTPEPVNYSIDHRKEYPPLARSAKEVNRKYGDMAWIDIDKPFWWDVPIILATAKINSTGIAHNHMNQAGVFDNEAWGKSRDTSKYPAPMGNGFWTQDVYYHILNSGFRLIPSAGSASGVLLNPLGYNRQYVYVDKGFTYDKWFEGLRKGNTFVTNGPILLCRGNGQLPGSVFSSPVKTRVKVTGEIMSRDSLASVEIIKNGKLYKIIAAGSLKNGRFGEEVAFDSSGWFLVRVIAKVPGNFRLASTAPFYVEIGNDKKFISRTSARFFLDWVNTRAKNIRAENAAEEKEIYEYVDKAKTYWQDLLAHANGD